VGLVAVAKNWPDAIRREILAAHLAASVNIPFDELEAAMKRGKAVFSWKQLRLWYHPKPSTALSEHDAANLDLPLSVLAPLFLARRGETAPARKAVKTEEIPDVFHTRKPGEPSASEVKAETQPEARPAPQPTLESLASIALPQPGAKPATSAASASSAPDALTLARSSALPMELVQRACHLNGVAGALLTTTDGLVIASQMPSSMNSDAAAGFIPQIYSRLAQYTRELKLGEPGQVEIIVGKVPLQIMKTPSSFFAVLGKAAEPLPKLQLTALAGQLSPRTN
jgi:predicted regulator of Ras-like GTPase activity (Roadblock/LC7/MglB family)